MQIENRQHIAVIIPFFNNAIEVQQCVQSILNQEFDRENIVISIYMVDNSEKNIDLKNINNSKCHIVRTKPAIGFARSVNIGIQKAINTKSDFCLILNQDAILSQQCIEKLMESPHWSKKSTCNIASPLVLDPQTKKVPAFHQTEYFHDYSGNFAVPFKIENYQGCSFIIDLNSCEHPFLDPLFHMYYEDEDFLNRQESSDEKKIWILPEAIVYHSNQGALNLDKEEKQRNIWKLKSKIIFHLRHSNELPKIMLFRHWLKSCFLALSTLQPKIIQFSILQDMNIIRNWKYIRKFSNQDIAEKAMAQIRKDTF